MGRHVAALLAAVESAAGGSEYTAHGAIASCLRKALAADEAAAGWRPRPPTPEELQAHHAAHASDAGVSLWLCRRRGLMVTLHHHDGRRWMEAYPDPDLPQEWRPATCEGVACEWLACGGPEPTGEVAL